MAGAPPTAPNPLDDVLLDRLALAAAAVVERYGPARTTMADPALIEVVISSGCDEAARVRALRLLGFAADLPVRAVAVRSRLPLDRIGSLSCPARPVKAAHLADVGVLLSTTVDATCLPAGVRASIGAAESPARSWQQAHTAPTGRPLRHAGGAGAPGAGAARGGAGQRRRGRHRPHPGHRADRARRTDPIRAGLALTAWRLLDD
ncbi:hypothetical protein AB0A69_22780 [Streptomyces sp. NPDC045431]|uniref:hypothetical protein n=1 Tax=Streptomyces sp. NPDC045431 TaxID=3155613 RepID=UPI003401B330